MVPAPPSQAGEPTRRVERLRRRQDFIAVLHEGRRVRHRLVSLGVRPNGLTATRVGYAIGKRVGTAVVRNQTRRRLREIVRALPLVPGYDVVITGHPASADASFQALRESLDWCARRASILANSGESS